MEKINKKGFTLIELLVVIAIISLLASVVLASLSSARVKAADANIQETLSSLRTQAAIYLEDHNNFGAESQTCSTAGSMFIDPQIDTLINSAEALSTQPANCRSSVASDGSLQFPPVPPANYWRVYVPLRATAGTFWCVDSAGSSKLLLSAPPSNLTCP